MSSAAGSPVGEGSSQLPTVPKKRGRKEGTTSKAKGKGKAAAAREGGDGDSGEQQQQSQRGVTPQQQSSQPSGSASRDDTMQGGAGAGPQAAAAAANDSSRPAKKERTEKRGGQKLSRKNLFAKDCEWLFTTNVQCHADLYTSNNAVPEMMYAFGDDPNPLPESVNVLEEIIVDYLSELVG
jgi:hypothetical protein